MCWEENIRNQIEISSVLPFSFQYLLINHPAAEPIYLFLALGFCSWHIILLVLAVHKKIFPNTKTAPCPHGCRLKTGLLIMQFQEQKWLRYPDWKSAIKSEYYYSFIVWLFFQWSSHFFINWCLSLFWQTRSLVWFC